MTSIWLLERKTGTDVEFYKNNRYSEYKNVTEATKNRIKKMFPPIFVERTDDDGWIKERCSYDYLPVHLFVERHPIKNKIYSLLTIQ